MTALWNLVQNSKFSFNWKERLREAPYCKFEQIHQITVIASPKKRNCYSKQLNFCLLLIFKIKIPKSKRYVQRDIGNARWIFWNLNSAAVSPILNQMTFIWHVAEVTGVHWTLFRYFHFDQYFTNISNLFLSFCDPPTKRMCSRQDSENQSKSIFMRRWRNWLRAHIY